MSDPKESTGREKASAMETAIANSGPAILTNRFYITLGPFGVRIAFAEMYPGQPPSFRTAVVMSIPDGIALYKVLQDLLKEAEASMDKAMAQAQSTKSNA